MRESASGDAERLKSAWRKSAWVRVPLHATTFMSIFEIVIREF